MLPILCAIDYLGVLILLKSDCVELPLLSGSDSGSCSMQYVNPTFKFQRQMLATTV